MADADEPKRPKTMHELFKKKLPSAPQLGRVDDKQEERPEPDDTEADESDAETDAAVDDIVKNEGDDVLRAQDEAVVKAEAAKPSFKRRFKDGWLDWWTSPRKRNSTIGVIVLILVATGVVPAARYSVVGLVVKSTATVTVVDSKSGDPVSGAIVTLAGQTAETDAAGKATLQVRAGTKRLKVSKQYYQSVSQREMVALSGNSFKVSFVALGHQVQVKVVNKLTGAAVSGATLTVRDTNTKTNESGTATVVIPSNATVQEASVSLNGYNTVKVNIFASGDLAKNTFGVVPSGKLYFLSNLSGTVDVVKTDLDGSNRQTVLAGTGSEDTSSTSLLASRDWKYLALLSKRSGDNASVYLIDTTDGDKLTTIDQGNASFSLAGWSGDKFVYTVNRSATVQDWQSHQQALKSFDPTTGQSLLLDQTQGSGSSSTDYVKQTFGTPYLFADQVVYAKNWQGFGSSPLSGKSAELDAIGADGSGHKTLKTFAPENTTGYGYSNTALNTVLYEPQGLYIEFGHGDNTYDFYTYEDGKITPNTDLDSNKFWSSQYSTTYLLSPSGNQTFWSEPRDGKNTLFTGDQNAAHRKQVASLSEYNTYGWYTDGYLLVSKNSSELYVMPTTGGTPYKITDYYKPAITYNGYGGGYGGL